MLRVSIDSQGPTEEYCYSENRNSLNIYYYITSLLINEIYQEINWILAKVVIPKVEPMDNVIRGKELAIPHQSHHNDKDI